MGSAAATVVGAVVTGLQGFAKGALRASSAQVAIPDQQPVPPPYQPAPLPPPEEPPLPLRKVRSTQDLFITTIDKPHPPCPVCDQGKKGKHTYMGTCKGMPWEVWQQQQRSLPQVENPTSGQAASSAEPLPINTTTMTEDLAHVLDQDDGTNIELPPTSHSLGQAFGSAKSLTLYPEFVVSSNYLQPQQEMPQPGVVASPTDDLIKHLILQVDTLLASQDELRRTYEASQEELRRAIDVLQNSNVNLLIR